MVATATFEYYKTQAGIESCANGVYSKLRWPYSGERYHCYALFGTDLFQTATGTHGNGWDQYQSTALNPTTSLLYSLWVQWYEAISACNTGLYYLEEQEDSEWKNHKEAELKYLRAYFFFDLVQQFGAIPMPIEPTFTPVTDVKRTAVRVVYKQIINDLKFAADNNYLPEIAERGKVTRGAAQHLLAKVYLTRASASTMDAKLTRGTTDSDLKEAARYADMVINSGSYALENDFAAIFDINNKDSKEVIFTVNFTTDEMWNGSGNPMHMYSTGSYQNEKGMQRDTKNGRAWSRIRQTFWVMKDANLHGGLFDFTNDARGEKSFKHVWYSNNASTIPNWGDISDSGTVLWSPSAALKGTPKFELEDTCIVIKPIYLKGEGEGKFQTRQDSLVLFGKQHYNLWSMERLESVRDFWPIIEKWANGERPDMMYEAGQRNFNIYRLGETYLIAAEAYGRMKQFSKAADRLNAIRQRAAYKAGDWRSNLNTIKGIGERMKSSTFDNIKVTSSQLAMMTADEFINFMLDERARELIGEDNRWNDLNRCEKLIERFEAHNGIGGKMGIIRPYHTLRPIPQNHIDRLDPAGDISEEQNLGWY